MHSFSQFIWQRLLPRFRRYRYVQPRKEKAARYFLIARASVPFRFRGASTRDQQIDGTVIAHAVLLRLMGSRWRDNSTQIRSESELVPCVGGSARGGMASSAGGRASADACDLCILFRLAARVADGAKDLPDAFLDGGKDTVTARGVTSAHLTEQLVTFGRQPLGLHTVRAEVTAKTSVRPADVVLCGIGQRAAVLVHELEIVITLGLEVGLDVAVLDEPL